MRSKLSPPDGARLLGPVPSAAEKPGTGPALQGTVTGTCTFFDPVTGQSVDGRIVNGCFTVTEFLATGSALQATGTLTGTCATDDATGPTFTQEVTAPVGVAVTCEPGNCRSLRLWIGRIDLDRPGLLVHTGEPVIAVTAQSGLGHLPGNLLGAVANSLTSDARATHVAELLNHFLSLAG